MSGIGLVPLIIMLALWGSIIHSKVIGDPVLLWQWIIAVVYSIGAISYITINLKK
ncbi:hypothetical protein [Psychromonas algarum]|uniref:hypothetical protein n=1 Tax=Psychromonas algarum TaxID=2555643 RepID=UPI00141928CD|nr:hypothetical protein [Psychromonas sp. RZ22]